MEMHSKISVQNNQKTVKCDEDMSQERYISKKKRELTMDDLRLV